MNKFEILLTKFELINKCRTPTRYIVKRFKVNMLNQSQQKGLTKDMDWVHQR